MKPIKSVVILFSGGNVHDAPKLKNLYQSLETKGIEVKVVAIVKEASNAHLDANYKLYSKGNVQGVFKVLLVFLLQIRMLAHLLIKDRSEMVYAINPISGIIGLIVSRLTGKRLIYESHEMTFGLNYPFFKGRWRHMWSFLEKQILKACDKFILTDRYRLIFTRRYYKAPSEKLEFLLNVPKHRKTLSRIDMKEKLTLTDRYIVSYCGGIIPGRELENIIDSFAELHARDKKCFLLLAGSVAENYKAMLVERLERAGIPQSSFVFTGRLQNDKLFEYMCASDVTFALYQKNSLNNRMSSPNKIFDAIHAETLLICSDSFLCREIIDENDVGKTVRCNASECLIPALLEVHEFKLRSDENKFKSLKDTYNWDAEFERAYPSIFL